MKVLVLGAGKMIEAILKGFAKTEDLSKWQIYTPSGESAMRLASKIGASAVKDLDSVDSPDWVLVGCKPQQLHDLCDTLNGRFSDSLFVSVLAAVSEADQIRILKIEKLIRVMPNLPVEYNEGVSLIASESAMEKLSSFKEFFSKLGVAETVSENELEELTLLTGSGPAFFYEFALSLSGNFTSLNNERREILVRQVLAGAAKASKSKDRPLSEMVDEVTSKAGVTIAVLTEWRTSGFKAFIGKGIAAGKKRSSEIMELLRS